MPQIEFMAFLDPKKKKCCCCDRTMMLTRKINFLDEEGRLVGDLELCSGCADTLAEALSMVKEVVEQQWNFEQ